MTRTRLAVVLLFLGAAGATAFLGFTDGKLEELQYAWPAPLVVGLIALATAKKPRTPPVFTAGDWKGADPALLHTLGTRHGFSPAQLEENRAGRLHAEQQALGLRLGRSDKRFGLVLLCVGATLALACFAVPFFPRALKDLDFQFAVPEKPAVALFVGAFLAAMVATLPLVFGFAAWREGRRVEAGYLAGRACVAEGRLEKLVIRRRRGASSWHYVVNGVQLQVARDAWQATELSGPVRVYFCPGHAMLLALEPA